MTAANLPPPSPAREIELKLTLPRDALMRVKRAGALSRLPGLAPCGRARAQTLRATYWDTGGDALAAHGIALRIRCEDGRFVQTVKAESRGQGLAADRLEVSAVLPAAGCAGGPAPGLAPDLASIPDKALRRRIRALAKNTALAPRYETDISRTARTYRDAHGSAFEAALDLGEIRAAERSEPVSEIELEWRSGSPVAMLDAAIGLARAYPVRVGMLSKAARARRLIAPEPPRAVAAGPVPRIRGLPPGAACAAILSACTAQIAANQDAILLGERPEGIHQMRVGIRRYRAAYAGFRGAVELPGGEAVVVRLRDLFHTLGAARDLDVFGTETLPALRAAAPGGLPPLDALAAAAEEARAEAWAAVRAALEAPAFAVLLLEAARLAARAGEAPAGDPGDLGRLAAARLARHWRQAAARARHIEALDDAGRHDLRKRLKKFRYDVEFFGPLWPARAVRPVLKPLKRLQTVFGAINDAATAGAMARLAANRVGGPDIERAAGYVAGWSAARAGHAFGAARAEWDRLAAARPFWRAKSRN